MDLKKKRIAEDGNIDNSIPAGIYPVIDTDLGRDNIENDIPAADLQDLHRDRPKRNGS